MSATEDEADITFAGGGGTQLSGVLTRPDVTARGSVLLAHCFTCSKDLHTMTRLSRGLAEAGYASLRFDFTGLGESGGTFAESTVSRNVEDLIAAARTLIERGYGPCAMVGHSLGGAATLLAAAKLPTVRSLAVVGAPSTAAHVRHLFAGDEAQIRADGATEVEIGGRSFTIGRDFLDALDANDTTGHIGALDRPLLVVHSPDDEIVPVAEGERTFAAAAQPKAFVPLLGADHLVSDRGHAEALLQILTGWFDATL